MIGPARVAAVSSLLLLLVVVLSLLPLSSAKLRVHLIGHSHTDVGWLKTVDQYYAGTNRSIVFGNVHQILDSVLLGLTQNPQRRFSYGEQAFFQRWYRRLSAAQKAQVAAVVANGQLEFINGGWCMHDEADTHFVDMIDQTALGHRYIVQQFGERANPRAGWQIDTFGHSATHIALLTGEVGLQGTLFARIDYQDFAVRTPSKSLEWIWRPSPSLGQAADTFAYAFAPVQLPPGMGKSGYYGAPYLFCFNLKCYNGDEARPIQDDPALDDYNVPQRVDDAVRYAAALAEVIQGDNQLWLVGDDFYWEDANHNFLELDKLIRHVNANGSIEILYSTPSTYIAAKYAEGLTFPYKFDDEFPYGTGQNSYWSGYFSSRPSLKRYVRVQSAALNVGRHWEAFAGGNGSSLERLWEALSVVQHHDAVAGTARQVVTDDYSMRLARGFVEADAATQRNIATVISRPSAAPMALMSCPLANYSVCPTSQASSSVVVLLYNPLARTRTETHSVPVQTAGVQVVDSRGMPLQSQVVAVAKTQARMALSAPYEVQWQATVQGLGLATFFIQPNASRTPTDTDGIADRTARHAAHSRVSAAPSAVLLENDCWAISMDSVTGNITSVLDKAQNRSFALTLSFMYYKAGNGRGGSSSHYTFNPDGEAVGIDAVPVLVGVVSGPVTREARVTISDWIAYSVRLHMQPCDAGGAGIELDYVIGPVPTAEDRIGKEVIVRYASPDIRSGAAFFTDSNGREWQPRVRDQRPTWNLTLTEPVSSNYYPVVTGLYVKDEATQQSLLVLNDRANGGSSLHSGEVELMLHRRLVGGLLSGEALDEQQFGQGLVIRGANTLLLGASRTVARLSRALQSRLYSPLAASYAPLTVPVPQYLETHNASLSFVRTALPAEVELLSLYVRLDGALTLRLAHSYGVNETDAAPLNDARGVTVDLSLLFTAAVASVQQRTLTDNADKATVDAGRLRWKGRGGEERTRHVSDRSRSGLWADGFNVTILPMEVLTFRITLA